MSPRLEEDLYKRWQTKEGQKVYNTILKHLADEDSGWKVIYDQMKALPRRSEVLNDNFDFRGIDLSGVNMSNGKLAHIEAEMAMFDNCSMDNLFWQSSDVSDASLNSIHGENSTFMGLKISMCEMNRTNFVNSEFILQLSDVSFSNAILKDTTLNCISDSYNISFINSFFSGSNIFVSKLGGNKEDKDNIRDQFWLDFNGARFTDKCKLYLRGTWNSLNFDNVEMIGLDLHKESGETDDPFKNCSSFKNANLSKANFTGLDQTSANFEGANLEGTNFTNAILENANFTGANLKGTIFTDAKMEGAIGLD